MSGAIRFALALGVALGPVACGASPEPAGPIAQQPDPDRSAALDTSGVREDVRDHIASTYQGKARTAALQYAVALGHKLVDADAPLETRLQRVTEVQRAVECLYHSLPPADAEAARTEIRARSLDNADATRAYARSDRGMGGRSFARRSSAEIEQSCVETTQELR